MLEYIASYLLTLLLPKFWPRQPSSKRIIILDNDCSVHIDIHGRLCGDTYLIVPELRDRQDWYGIDRIGKTIYLLNEKGWLYRRDGTCLRRNVKNMRGSMIQLKNGRWLRDFRQDPSRIRASVLIESYSITAAYIFKGRGYFRWLQPKYPSPFGTHLHSDWYEMPVDGGPFWNCDSVETDCCLFVAEKHVTIFNLETKVVNRISIGNFSYIAKGYRIKTVTLGIPIIDLKAIKPDQEDDRYCFYALLANGTIYFSRYGNVLSLERPVVAMTANDVYLFVLYDNNEIGKYHYRDLEPPDDG